jgi:hypothetical protein
MQWIGLGKVTVASAGTPVPLANSKLMVEELLVTYDPVDVTKVIYVKDVNGNIMASMASVTSQPISFKSPGQNQIDLSKFLIDVGTNGAGPYVSYGIN